MRGNGDSEPYEAHTNIRFYTHKENTRWYVNKSGLYLRKYICNSLNSGIP